MKHFSSRISILAPRSNFYQGPYGRIFPELPAWNPPLQAKMTIEKHLIDLASDMKEKGRDSFSDIPAGYTYFGQFVDHDITFDPASSLMRQNDPSGLLNHRTPRLDLDSVYGGGPDASPYLYQKDDSDLFLVDPAKNINPGDPDGLMDLPRNSEDTALIGDPRNDENAIVCQLHLSFLLAHNTLVLRAREAGHVDAFEKARTTLRWLYQYIVWNDFLRRITMDEVRDCALSLVEVCGGGKQWQLGLKHVYNWKNNPFMPVEFSVAAYRFGHSMVRNEYFTSACRGASQKSQVPIFDSRTGDDLRGGRPLDVRNYIQWDWFLHMGLFTRQFPQPSGAIDTQISTGLFDLPGQAEYSKLHVLPFRNLLRGHRFDLPSGSSVAQNLGFDPIDIKPEEDALWYYILKEAELGKMTEAESNAIKEKDASLKTASIANKLGPVGSTILCATFAGLLFGDPNSYLAIRPGWTPDDDPLLTDDDNQDPGDWTLASIIRLSGMPVNASRIQEKCRNDDEWS